MRRVAGSVLHLHRVRISNVFLLDGGPGDRWLVDTGFPLERGTLLGELRRAGIAPADLTGIVLTHRHSDHAGNARYLQERHGIRVHAHRADAEILEGRATTPRLTRRGGSHLARVLAEIENRFPVRLRVDRALDDGDAIGSLEVHWVPGHTEGSVFYRHAGTRTLLSGDTLVTAVPPLIIRRGFGLPYVTFSTDPARAIQSLAEFHGRGFGYENLLAGHGPPILGDARAQALRFLEREGVLQSGTQPSMSHVSQ
ncbi:MAG: MBL fold metallo-hydrolase [Deltaproteobacteria bacterium]|nr:MBL fold metallo-hydrolase [Deltaproteobacteria bacterium]